MNKNAPDPELIDNYEFLEKIGEGSFGDVWLVKDLKRSENIALKYLRLDIENKDYLDMFKGEFEILSEIRHKNIANVYDFGFSSSKNQYFFTSEYCEGREFIEVLKGKSLSYIEETLVQILSALDYTHSQGIVHFDIKSENILVSDVNGHPHVKLLDFGVAAKLKSLPKGVIGTPAYMAPEILIKGATVDHRADLYSLGILLLRTFTGKLPFDTQDTDAVFNWHLHGQIPDDIWQDVEIPKYMQELVEKLLEKKAADRFSNARVILHFLNVSTGRRYLKIEQNLEGKIPREGPLVERSQVLEELRNRFIASFFSESSKPVKSVSLISGSHGMGKTRILNELRQTIELKEILLFEIVCNWQIPTWPKIEKWLNIKTVSAVDMSEDWLVKIRVDAIIEAARKKPCALLIDDFHKADRTTKKLLTLLSSKVEHYRSIGKPIRIFVLAASEETTDKSIILERLSTAAISEYINLVLGETERNNQLAELLYKYSGGLPLLMVEGLRFLAPHLYKNEPLENLLPPPQIGALYGEKIGKLTPEENDTLSILALLFRPSTNIELSKIMGIPPGKIVTVAEQCIRKELVSSCDTERETGKCYQVSSQALSLDIVKSMDPKRALVLHKKIARGLGSIPGVPTNEIAYHAAKSGNTQKAIALYKDASKNYKEHHEVAAATDCLVKAIKLSKPSDTEWQDLLIDTSQLLIISGDFKEAKNYLDKFDRETASSEELKGLIELKKNKFDESKKHYEKALKLLPRDSHLQRILIENSLGNLNLQQGNFEEAIRIFNRTLSEEKILSDEDRRKVTNNSLGLSLALTGQIKEALKFYEEKKKELDPCRTNDEISMESSMGYVHILSSSYDESIPHLKRAVELSERSGAMHSLFSNMGNLLAALLKEAKYAETLPLLAKMRNYQERFGTQHDIAFNCLREGSVYLIIGLDEAAHDCFKRGQEICKKMNFRILGTWFLLMEAYRERDLGNLEKAKTILQRTEQEANEYNDKDILGWSLYSLAEIAHSKKDKAVCKKELDKINFALHDDELRIRADLLYARLKEPSKSETVESIFAPLKEKAKKAHLQELLWEVYYAWARAEDYFGNKPKAMQLMLKGIHIVEAIASDLPEEYRLRYLKQRSRKKLFDKFKGMTAETKSIKAEKEKIYEDIKAKPEGTVANGSTLKRSEEGTVAESPDKKKT